MIRCLLVQVTRNQRAQAIRKERRIAGDIIGIGRASECKIHLLDHRVNLHHAVIRAEDDGKLHIEAENTALNINDEYDQNAELTPGMRILIGPYQLIVEAIAPGHELTLTCELIHPISGSSEAAATRMPTTLSGAGLSTRKFALWLTAALTLAFLVLPIAHSFFPALNKWEERLPVALEESWNAGQMSPGHRALSMKCETCHQRPFTPVADTACISCHKNIANHIKDDALHAKVFRNVRCAECHLDHRGKTGLVRHDTTQCVACHGNIKARHASTKLSNIHDFSTDHPAFQLTVRTAPGDSGLQRIRQTDKSRLIEQSGLKFSHKEHLDKALIELGAPGKTRDIQCDDCHKMDDAGARFKPMTMSMTCQQSRCHALDFEPKVAGRQVPHAAEQTVMTTLREFYASRAISKTYADGVTVDDLRRARDWASAQAARNARLLFATSGEGTCLECHEVSYNARNKEVPWTVAPVDVTDHWLPKSRFPHIKHQTAKCTDCHKVADSDKSTDIAIPAISKCRECHVGSKQTKTQVSSNCDTCHSFHNANAQPARQMAKETEE
ncbi:MAG TPA: cytochrome c3 family protein [Novimethylophilus sp.]|jgi:hypothetical protein|uniref:cytochrome c3 family protein n=1 Tax=Novimethylophilus sp. TaxID=2137426 RepID=UPI002F410B7D